MPKEHRKAIAAPIMGSHIEAGKPNWSARTPETKGPSDPPINSATRNNAAIAEAASMGGTDSAGIMAKASG